MQKASRRLTGALPFREGLHAIDDDRTVAGRTLNAAPVTARQVVNNFTDPVRLDAEALHVVNHDVSRETLAQHSAIAETCGVSRQRRHAIVRLFEGELLLVA